MTEHMTRRERAAVRADAKQQLKTLVAEFRRLAPDVDDATVLSELTTIVGQIRAIRELLAENGTCH